MKKTLMILLFLSISCSDKNDNLKQTTMNGKQIFTLFPMEEICYDGVVYLFHPNRFSSVKFNKEGKIETCQ
jgi:hypothetical protein